MADGADVDEGVEESIRFLDGVRGLPHVEARKAGLAAALALDGGERVLEIGPGTGEDLQRFADRVGEAGVAVGAELEPGIAVEAKRRAESAGRANVVLVVADVRSLPFRGRAFDALYVERVLQHVPAVERAVAEMARVLVDGGRALVFEPDQELRAFDHPDAEVERLLRARLSGAYANPTIGRRLQALLTDAGLGVDRVEGVAWGQPMAEVADVVRDAVAAEVAAGSIDRARGDGFLSALEARVAGGVVFTTWVAFEAAAVKRT